MQPLGGHTWLRLLRSLPFQPDRVLHAAIRWSGMTFPVANFLVENVFCVLDDPSDDSQRIGAREFGIWVRELPALMGASQSGTHTHSRVPSTASMNYGHALASAPRSHRPSSRPPSVAAGSPRRPPTGLRSLSRTTSVDAVLDRDGSEGAVRPALGFVLDEDEEEDLQQQRLQQPQEQPPLEQQPDLDDGRSPSPSVRSTSNTKRRKRGRKGKGMTPSLDHVPNTAELLASASQSLVRELSRQPRSASASVQSFPNVPPPPPVPAPVSTPTVTKKPSRWKLSFGRAPARQPRAHGPTRSRTRTLVQLVWYMCRIRLWGSIHLLSLQHLNRSHHHLPHGQTQLCRTGVSPSYSSSHGVPHHRRVRAVGGPWLAVR